MTTTQGGVSAAVYSTKAKELIVRGWFLPPAKSVSVVLRNAKGRKTTFSAEVNVLRPDLASRAGPGQSLDVGWHLRQPLPNAPLPIQKHYIEVVDHEGVTTTQYFEIKLADEPSGLGALAALPQRKQGLR